MSQRTLAAALFASLTLPPIASATTVQVDFNDLAAGSIVGQSGGTGFNNAWAGSTVPQVISGDLVAPASTHFGLTQGGTGQSYRGDSTSTGAAADSRTLSTPLSGTVWFSFLVNTSGTGARGGVEINPTYGGAGYGGQRILAVDNNLRVIGASDLSVSNVFTSNQTALVLGQIIVNPAGTDTINIWVNPDVLNLGTPTLTNSTLDLVPTTINNLGVESYRSSAATGATVDRVTFSDDPGAFAIVTGVPTPAALPAGLMLMGLGGLRRRGRRA